MNDVEATAWPVSALLRYPEHRQGWEWVPLVEVADLVTGHTPDRGTPDYWEGGISWVNLNEIRDLDGTVCFETKLKISHSGVANSSAVVHPKGTVCMSRTASVGFVAIMGSPMATSQDFVNWICGDQIEPAYLMRALMASRPQIRALSSGSTHKTIYMRDALKLRVLLPPIDQQRRIAGILDTADELRRKRREVIEKLDSLAQSVYIDMFGDPVASDRQWPVAPIGSVLSSATYGTSKKAMAEGGYPVLRMGNVTVDGRIDVGDLKFVDLDEKDLGKHLVHPGDVLFNRTNSADLVGKTAVFRGDQPMAYAGYLVRLRPTSELHPEYLGAFMNLPTTKQTLRSMCKSIVGMANINAREVQRIEMPLPPVDRQVAFARALDQIELRRSLVDTHAQHLDSLFGSLQGHAFRGDL